jgi:superfamily I DNA/RNA helicase
MTTTWSTQQEEIFSWFRLGRGNLVIEALAGTGKTTTVVEAISHAPENKILMCAFNKKIAMELSSRIRHPGAEAKTLHSLGFKYVMRNWNGVKLDDERPWRLAKQADPTAPDPITRLASRLASAGKNCAPFGTVDQLIDLALERELDPDPEWEEEGWTVERVASIARRAMDLSKVRDGAIDFDDMIWLPVVMRWVRPWFDLVVVDEAQDMNICQLIIAQGASRGRIAAVGDSHQAIYGFRGADSGALGRLEKELRATKLKLSTTYRCPKRIVALAQKFVPEYVAAPTAPEGLVTNGTPEQLYQLGTPGDFVLSRKNAPLAKVCLRFLRDGKRARIEGKDIGASLISLVKKLRGRSIPDFLQRLTAYTEKQEARIRASAKPGQEEKTEGRIEQLHDKVETLRSLAEDLASVTELEARIGQLFNDAATAPGGQIVCSSVHKAKGLEADRVFVLKDTLREWPEEEKNISYVAITRAKRELVWIPGIS